MILVINSGSTSLKYKLFSLEGLERLKSGRFKIGEEIKDHRHGVRLCLREIGNLEQIKKIGHRIVHGGTGFSKTIRINREVIRRLEAISYLAPLHNPANLEGIKACLEYLPRVENFAVFDTAFFNTLPQVAYTYALPQKLIKQYQLRRFGFHGISHKFATEEAAKRLKRPLLRTNLIVCHLGGGASISAIKQGKAIDTSMGFTPMEGLVMLTRSGDLDPGIIFYLLRNKKEGALDNHSLLKRIKLLYKVLNYESGLYGLAGYKSYLDLLKHLDAPEARLAFDLFIYRIKKYIGAYFAILKRVDAVVFTGQIGAGDPRTRQAIVRDLNILKGVKKLSFETDEEYMIAQEVVNLLK